MSQHLPVAKSLFVHCVGDSVVVNRNRKNKIMQLYARRLRQMEQENVFFIIEASKKILSVD